MITFVGQNTIPMRIIYSLAVPVFLLLTFSNCENSQSKVYTIGFLDIVEDATLAMAREGFQDVMRERGWSEDEGNVRFIFRNAQGDMATLVQSVEYFATRPVDLIAANATVSTISAVQRSRGIPVCMMVAPEPSMVQLTDENGHPPAHLFGVFETMAYIDTSLRIIRSWMPDAAKVGVIYNQAEPQSINALERLTRSGREVGIEIVALPVTNSSETQLVTQALVNRQIDAFFAMPDNIIFASFEVVHKICSEHNIPIFTSEAGLVMRGAVAAYGADFYRWGYQAGQQAADFFDSGMKDMPDIAPVQYRQSVYHPEEVKKYSFEPGPHFVSIKTL